MPEAQIATSLGIVLLVALSTHVFYRRPPAALWPALPLVFFSALIFSLGDLLANVWPNDSAIRWGGMIMLYTGLLTIAPGWLLFTRGFSEMVGYRKIAFRSALPVLVTIDALLWIGLVTNPWHGQFIETRPLERSEYGPLWYATALINYAALCAAVFVHAREGHFVQDPTIRTQCRFLVAAVFFPMSMNMIYVFSPVPLSYDPTALGFAISCLLFLFAVERRDLFVLERVSLPSVLDHDADPIVIVTRHQQILYANPHAEKLFGQGRLKPGAPIGELLELTVPSFSLTESNNSAPHPREHQFTSPSGIVSFVVIEVSIVEKSRGNEAGMCLRLRDRTALRTALHESAEQFALLETLDLAMGEGLLFKEQSGEIRYVNEAFARLWGMSTREMIDRGHQLQTHLGTMLLEPPPKTMQRMWNPENASFQSTRAESCDLAMRDGRTLEARTMPIETERGFRGRAWVLSDVTQARQESQAMIQSQKLEGLGLLAGGIAHDFNNLLMTILGNTEIAREGIHSDSPVHGALADVEVAATTAAELTSQLLAYAGKTTFITESLDLSLLIREVTSLISVTIPKSIGINFRLEDELPLIRGGSAQLRQVLMNLVTNAAEAIGDARGTIEISTGIGPPGPMSDACASIEHGQISGDVVHVTVCDNGAGMDIATLGKIFDPFFTTKFAGRGLGLAATRGILDSHEGQLRIETELGVGSTFTFLLPVQEGSRHVSKKTGSPVHSGGFANRDVLVVDDEAQIRAVLTKHLAAVGFNVHVAADGEQALAAVEEIGPALHLVILDLGMPGLSGVETWSRLRKTRAELPIIISSGHPEEALEELEGWNTAYDGFIQKPYRSQSLLLTVKSLLDSSES
ncbi:MAG: histidine kinase N-terminal 7TM domain-containing protein [Myxococcales bacterium]|nr:response regulator [Myxococcales bacterium]HIL80903.1 response regulator [Myxococcales bacterium]